MPVRQWVLSLPIPLRVLLAAQPELATHVLQVVQRVITRHLLGQATVHYVARVGLDHCKARMLDDAANRKALWERLQFALDGEPDPWFDFEKAGVDMRQFQALSAV